jgi:hypothetical protein
LQERDIRIADNTTCNLFLATPDVFYLVLPTCAFLGGKVRARRAYLSLMARMRNLWVTALWSRSRARICAFDHSTTADGRMYDSTSAIASQLDTT